MLTVNKLIKILSFVFALLLALSIFCVSALAVDDEIEYKNDRFSVTVPVDYILINNYFESDYGQENYYFNVYDEENDYAPPFISEDGSLIEIYSGFNTDGVDINKMNDEVLEKFAVSCLKPADGGLCSGVSGEYENIQVRRTKINGCACACLSTEYVCCDGKLTKNLLLYAFTAEQTVYVIYFCGSGGFDRESMLTVLSSFSMNDTHFEGDKELNPADFSDALPYDEAKESQLEMYGSGYYGYDEYDAEFEERIWPVVSTVLFIVPSVLIPLFMLIILTALLYTDRKNKKKIAEYQNKYGNII